MWKTWISDLKRSSDAGLKAVKIGVIEGPSRLWVVELTWSNGDKQFSLQSRTPQGDVELVTINNHWNGVALTDLEELLEMGGSKVSYLGKGNRRRIE